MKHSSREETFARCSRNILKFEIFFFLGLEVLKIFFRLSVKKSVFSFSTFKFTDMLSSALCEDSFKKILNLCKILFLIYTSSKNYSLRYSLRDFLRYS